jgi:hypothetical protein
MVVKALYKPNNNFKASGWEIDFEAKPSQISKSIFDRNLTPKDFSIDVSLGKKHFGAVELKCLNMYARISYNKFSDDKFNKSTIDLYQNIKVSDLQEAIDLTIILMKCVIEYHELFLMEND